MIKEFKQYFKLAHLKQQQKFEGLDITDDDIGDDLINNVPIYDVIHRRYAAFSSLPEALIRKHKDPKGYGKHFESNTIPYDINFSTLLYLFRLCGSGINYKPGKRGEEPYGTHGFGNFWVVDCLRSGRYRRDAWLDQIPDKGFADVKGYMLPLIKGGLRPFILKDAYNLVDTIWEYINDSGEPREIHTVVEYGNSVLMRMGYQRQNFVLCAFAIDLAEYFPKLVSPNSRVLVGSNARKCLKLILPNVKGLGTNLDVTNAWLDYLIEETGDHNLKMDMEDVCCDFIRYIENYQSPDHIKMNNGVIYKNSLHV